MNLPMPSRQVSCGIGTRSFQFNRDDVLNIDDKNWQPIVCRRCDAQILGEDKVRLNEGECSFITNLCSASGVCWWALEIHPLSVSIKRCSTDWHPILLCGDCELGPIGLRNPDERAFWIAAERVAYDEQSPVPPLPGIKQKPRKPKKNARS
ncbi:unnamed protein product [Heligmosomoides polygyrus]|uniref:Uncharacterized protein n=1 Tax=Heligmosomoides polygyrus TaxID=6339 RepID=A0A3P7THV1_HELPZ|nr:unnamed protein product [Heligmosomoides polygyrus]